MEHSNEKRIDFVNLDAEYWEERYRAGTTGWDIGSPSTPLKEYIDQLQDPSKKILIPGAGNAYEAEYLQTVTDRLVAWAAAD